MDLRLFKALTNEKKNIASGATVNRQGAFIYINTVCNTSFYKVEMEIYLLKILQLKSF